MLYKNTKMLVISATTIAVTVAGASADAAIADPGTQRAIEMVDNATSIAKNAHAPVKRSVSDAATAITVQLPNSSEDPTRLTDSSFGTLSIYGQQGALKKGDGFAVAQGKNTTVIQKRDTILSNWPRLYMIKMMRV
ncbi:hypothetical protein [Corynebacterium auriscanis]|uniref:hypothetical protein n=1 Tax=Corynebacterium auriscanis TaxID=99807 RepID=UPI0012EBA38F|nr:hypothetical protein [Corynebacterium auriscanis]